MRSGDISRRSVTLAVLLGALLACFVTGCASEREQRLKEQRKLHKRIREGGGEDVGKWHLKSGK